MNKLFITIDEPCHENWNDMALPENGRFCDHCTKEVIDLSSYSDNEIIAFVEKNKGKLWCGNFEQRQLNRWLESRGLKSTNPILYKFLVSMLLLAASQNSIAQQSPIQGSSPLQDVMIS